MDYMFIRYHQVKLVYMVRFYIDQDKKDAKIQKFLHYFVASWNTHNGSGKKRKGLSEINT